MAMIGDRVPHGMGELPEPATSRRGISNGQMAPEPPKSPKRTELEDRGPKGGERQLTQSVAEKAEWVAEARGRRAQEGRDTILAEALGAALPLHHC